MAGPIPTLKKEIIVPYLAAILLIAAGIVVFIVYRSFVWSAFTAVLLYIGFDKPNRRLIELLRGRRTLAASISLIAVLLLVSVPMIFLGRYIVKEAVYMTLQIRSFLTFDQIFLFAQKFPFLLSIVTSEEFFWVKHQKTVEGFLKSYGNYLDPDQFTLWLDDIYTFLLGSMSLMLKIADNLLFGMILLFFMFRDGPRLYTKISGVLPFPESIVGNFVRRVREMTYSVLKGIVFVSILQGIFLGIGLFTAGIPGSILYGTIAGIFSMIPIVGTAVVWLPAALYLALFKGYYLTAVVLSLYGLAVYLFLENVFKPKFLDSKLGIHSLFLFLAIIGGLKEFGISGIILGPLFVALFATLWEIYHIWDTDKQLIESGDNSVE